MQREVAGRASTPEIIVPVSTLLHLIYKNYRGKMDARLAKMAGYPGELWRQTRLCPAIELGTARVEWQLKHTLELLYLSRRVSKMCRLIS